MLKRTIKVGHSPDADDIFMYYAIKFGWISSEFVFENYAFDIQKLNEMALKNELDISAISFALYPLIAKEQCLLRTGVSFGEGYGPKLIKKKGTKLKDNFIVALSGAHTTNALIFKTKYKNARIIYKNFLDIESAVLSGEAHAGVLIHESILDFDDSLEVECEIWDIWQDLNKNNLPLPLGGMSIRRSIPLNSAIKCEEALTKAVQIAVDGKKILSKMLLDRNLVRVDDKKLEHYLNLYANNNSITLNNIQLDSINTLFKIGYDFGFYSTPLDVNDCLIPLEYKEFRES